MNIAFSPCPNDTFVFHAWVHGLLPDAPKVNVTYADIDITNHLATKPNELDVLKISYAALPWVLKEYALLPCGGALGRGCGPLVLTRKTDSSFGASALSKKRVAVPSERSTAYLLFRLWAEENVPGGVGEIIVMPFHEIMPAVRDGIIDAGLVIHEARFTYQQYELDMICDLGNWWETDTGFPIPLGAIIARRSLDLQALTTTIQQSVEYAWANPDISKPYILDHAQEMSEEVAKNHIQLYVNSFTANLGEEGYEAIYSLLGRAQEKGFVPSFDMKLLK
ncbi:1,4-dihydroxy-6-naphthoate synthase [Alkalihalobacterium bogoriense]|uniref:1,4-dihydroxy-6-naphthoate synthase n=1 Tax=Alkalihalobacterium bogoriense TaxID=246272 RepID=UPI00047DC480|nr:1,4-dihydroxy-6-naphthoate synthase [Alkalihalobacterium bogoriense]